MRPKTLPSRGLSESGASPPGLNAGDTEASTSHVDEDPDELVGVITDYYESRGYGFIKALNTDAEQETYFFHVSNLSDDWDGYLPASGYYVKFNTQFDEERNNRVATNVTFDSE